MLFLFVPALVLALLFGLGVQWMTPAGKDASAGEGLWWAVNHLLDGGALAAGQGLTRRALGLCVTLIGLVAVALLTGAFASTFSEQIRAFRSGIIPIFEREHLLLLGWNTSGGALLRELANSRLRITVVIIAEVPRELIEESLREHLDPRGMSLDIVVRFGDPPTISARGRSSTGRD